MGDIKSVKVDNWGVFFLQKLQNFFNKTDYCDLTLQFNDNSQLKVHRLVLSACTDFFNVLEQNCDMIDDALIMPNELQADVVVPIVNFMYTGTLEFELRMYVKLLKTARDMNMTVLLKLLEAHRRTMESASKVQPSPKQPNSRGGQWHTTKQSVLLPNQRRVASNSNNPNLRKINTPKQSINNYSKQSTYTPLKTKPLKGPARFDADESFSETFEPSFDNISYESRPLKEEPDDYEVTTTRSTRSGKNVSSTFEQLRQGYTNNNNKRPSQISVESPPEKKPNIEDVKEYAEQQRMRKQIAAEYGEDQEYESILDDEFHNDDDDEEQTEASSSKRSSSPSITIKQEPNQKPTIVVKDNSSIKMNHTKIISEVLKKYPHLIKDSKNIKLKILPNSSDTNSQRVMVKNADGNSRQPQTRTITMKRQQPSQQSILKPMPAVASSSISSYSKTSVASSSTTPTPGQPRRIDSKTMHALIAQGAENTTGPWLCLKCGVNGRPISIPSYRGFRRHLINSHKEKIDPRLCEHCGWRSRNHRDLQYHVVTVHDLTSVTCKFPKCDHCNEILFDEEALENHILENHANQQCIYCNEAFALEIDLYNHLKANHKEKAHEDGVIDFSDDDEMSSLIQEVTKTSPKIKILSDISLSSTKSSAHTAQAVGTEINTDMSLIETDQIQLHAAEYEDGCAEIAQEPKFINADGNEMVLTDEQRLEIMAQLERQDGGVFMVLNETVVQNKETTGETTNSAPSTGSGTGTMLEGYNEEDEQATNKSQSEVDDVADHNIDEEMEWAEGETSSQENDSQGQITSGKVYDEEEYDEKYESTDDDELANSDEKKDEIGLKLKQLAGEWSDDEEKDNDVVEQIKLQKAEKTEEAVKRLEAELSQVDVQENTQITENYEDTETANEQNTTKVEEETEIDEKENTDENIEYKLKDDKKHESEFVELMKVEFKIDECVDQLKGTANLEGKPSETEFKDEDEGEEEEKDENKDDIVNESNESSQLESDEKNFTNVDVKDSNVLAKLELNKSECLEQEKENQEDDSLNKLDDFKTETDHNIKEEEDEDNETQEVLSPKPTTSTDIQVESVNAKEAEDLEKTEDAIAEAVLDDLSTQLKAKNQITSLICEWEDGDDDDDL